MSSYNLKAKRRDTGEIVEVIFNDKYHYPYIIDGQHTTEYVFNTLYEVISDTQEGWREKADSIVGYVNGSLDALSQYMSMEGILKVNEMQEQNKKAMLDGFTQAYKQGQADAYKESAKLSIDNKKSVLDLYPTADIHTPTEKLAIQVTAKNEYNNACEHISLAIEQLSSKLVEIDHVKK